MHTQQTPNRQMSAVTKAPPPAAPMMTRRSSLLTTSAETVAAPPLALAAWGNKKIMDIITATIKSDNSCLGLPALFSLFSMEPKKMQFTVRHPFPHVEGQLCMRTYVFRMQRLCSTCRGTFSACRDPVPYLEVPSRRAETLLCMRRYRLDVQRPLF